MVRIDSVAAAFACGTMMKLPLSAPFALIATTTVGGGSVESATVAATWLPEQPNYSWHSTVSTQP
jgi:hypothetical protein